MSLAIKARLVVMEDCDSFFLTSLNVHILYKEEKAPTLSAFSDCSSLSLNTLVSKNRAYDNFVLTVVKNEVTYIAAAEVKEIWYNHRLANDTVVLMID